MTASDVPNIEPQGYYDILRDATLVRDGSLHGLDLLKLVGVLTFPSFHAASARLYTWAFWPMRWLRLIFAPCNNYSEAVQAMINGYFEETFGQLG